MRMYHFAVPSGLEIPLQVLLGPSFPLSCDTTLSLSPHSIPRISLLLYEPLDLGPQRLQILLFKKEGRLLDSNTTLK